MNTYIMEIHPFPYVLGNDSLVKVKSNKNINIVLKELEEKLKNENPIYEYDIYMDIH